MTTVTIDEQVQIGQNVTIDEQVQKGQNDQGNDQL